METIAAPKLLKNPDRKGKIPYQTAWVCAAVILASLGFVALPAWPQQVSTDLTNQSLEDLMNMEVTSVSKKEQKLSRTASAIFVITQEDIRRSEATNIPDLLRMVPGVDVAQISSSTWAISIRGFTEQFSDKLLVMVDGRTVYVPTFGGVFWDVLDMPLEDIERIEVIRGPGGTIWGANAVNGVINILTKKAAETQGGMISAVGGTLDQGFATTQYGGKLGTKTEYRVYSKYFNAAPMPDLLGPIGVDGWHVLRGGFRADTTFSSADTLSVMGDLYAGREGQSINSLTSITSPVEVADVRINLSGGFIQTLWNHTFSPRSQSTLQVSFDRYSRRDQLNETRDTLNLDFQHNFQAGERHDIIWGFDYRYTASGTKGSLLVSLNPADQNNQIFSSYLQDEIQLKPNQLYLTLGTKLEHNDFSGLNLLPGARLAWSPSVRQTFWAAVSRAVNTPTNRDVAIRVNLTSFTGQGGVPTLLALFGDLGSKNENLTAYEAGYRAQFSPRFSLDIATFYNSYHQMQTTEPGNIFSETNPPPPHDVLPLLFENLMYGETHGIEIAANWKVMNRWVLSPGYAFERIHMHLAPTSRDTTSVNDAEGSSPVQSAQLRSSVILGHGLEWNTSAYFVDRLPDLNLPSYTRLDTGLDWRVAEKLSLSFVGQNLAKDHHLEFVDSSGSVNSSFIKRSAYVKFQWQF